MYAPRRLLCFHAILISILLAAPTLAAIRYVDGTCINSGDGTTKTCGLPNGPFKTINEGISAMTAGDTLRVRAGNYNEEISLWGTVGDAGAGGVDAFGQALTCSVGSPCVIEGCPASDCGTQEVPIVQGMINRTDWADLGAGIWSRTMESNTTDYTPSEIPRDNFTPGEMMEGTTYPLTMMGYAGDNQIPGEGKWAYNTTTHVASVNPTGTGNPNTDPTTKIWVPNRKQLFVAQAGSSCPSTVACPENQFVTWRYIDFEGSRFTGLQFLQGNPAAKADNIHFDHVNIRYIPNMFVNTFNLTNGSFTNMILEYGGRGVEEFGATFGLRLSFYWGGTIDNVVVRHIGGAGQDRTDGDGLGIDCVMCEPPWNSKANTDISHNGTGFDIKQARDTTISHVSVNDASLFSMQLDVSRRITVTDSTFSRTNSGILLREFTQAPAPPSCLPSDATHYCNTYDITLTRNTFDAIGFSGVGVVNLYPPTGKPADWNFYAKIYNNLITRPACYALWVQGGSDQVFFWNNSVYGQSPYTSNTTAMGVQLEGAVTNSEFKNNIFSGLRAYDYAVDAAATGNIFENDLFYNTPAVRQGVARWGVTTYSGGHVPTNGTSYTTLAAWQAAELKELTGLESDPAFLDIGAIPPDLHVGATGAGINVGATLAGFSIDYDSQTRPQGPQWDIGADEFTVGGTTTSTSSSTSTSSTVPQPVGLLCIGCQCLGCRLGS